MAGLSGGCRGLVVLNLGSAFPNSFRESDSYSLSRAQSRSEKRSKRRSFLQVEYQHCLLFARPPLRITIAPLCRVKLRAVERQATLTSTQSVYLDLRNNHQTLLAPIFANRSASHKHTITFAQL